MINFGTSAYLKLISINPKPQARELKNRFMPSNGGYDFHAEMRRLAKKLMLIPNSKTEVIEKAKQINQKPERLSALKGLNNLSAWHHEQQGYVYAVKEDTYISQNEKFSVKFSPNFGYVLNNQKLAIHLWNTKTAKLNNRSVQAILSLFADKYSSGELPAILCLQSKQLYILDAAPDSLKLGKLFASNIEKMIYELEETYNDGPDNPLGPPSSDSPNTSPPSV